MDSMISPQPAELAKAGCPQLVLVWRSRELRFVAETEGSFSIGLERDSNLVVPGTYSSRRHATLRWHRNQFELVDHSTNGTFVQLEDEQVSHVHRTSVRLWGAGYLSFGEPLTTENALRFSHG